MVTRVCARVQPLTRVAVASAVHAALLDDLVFPTQIEARRTRYRTDGSKLLKVYLDPKGASRPLSLRGLLANRCVVLGFSPAFASRVARYQLASFLG